MTFDRRRTMRFTVLAAAMALTVTSVAGTAVVAQDEGDGTILAGLVTKTNTNPFFVKMLEGAEQAGEELGIEVQGCWGAFDPDNEGQVTCIENLIAAGADGLLITPADTSAIVPAIEKAKEAGMLTIALDTQTDPPDAVDATFATDNYLAGLLIGQWAAAKLGEETANAKIATLDLAESMPSVGRQRQQGFLEGFGVDVKDNDVMYDEEDARIIGAGNTNGAEDGGRTVMENLLQLDPGINVIYTINEPAAAGAQQALEAAGVSMEDVLLLSVDGGCPGVQLVADGVIDATSMQFPLDMAKLGVEAIKTFAETGEIPAPSEGLDFYNTGVVLITDEPMEGVDSQDSTWGLENCWG